MNKVVQSFSKSGRLHDNAVAESFFASMKREELYLPVQVRAAVFGQVTLTSIIPLRPQSLLIYKTLDKFEALYDAKKSKVG